MEFHQTTKSVLFPGIVLCLLSGCGGWKSNDLARFDISGTAKFKGQPIPAGVIYLEPDSNKGNSGPGTFAEIKDGTYKTPARKGVIGGHYLARVQGFDGVPIKLNDGTSAEQGRELFPEHVVRLDLPRKSTVQDIDVPGKK